MATVLTRIKHRLLGPEEAEKRYECVNCNTRVARQPFTCPECGCYQVNWIGWEQDRELIE